MIFIYNKKNKNSNCLLYWYWWWWLWWSYFHKMLLIKEENIYDTFKQKGGYISVCTVYIRNVGSNPVANQYLYINIINRYRFWFWITPLSPTIQTVSMKKDMMYTVSNSSEYSIAHFAVAGALNLANLLNLPVYNSYCTLYDQK